LLRDNLDLAPAAPAAEVGKWAAGNRRGTDPMFPGPPVFLPCFQVVFSKDLRIKLPFVISFVDYTSAFS
jgi:hypothetical protein